MDGGCDSPGLSLSWFFKVLIKGVMLLSTGRFLRVSVLKDGFNALKQGCAKRSMRSYLSEPG